jgi:hypothetical protein
MPDVRHPLDSLGHQREPDGCLQDQRLADRRDFFTPENWRELTGIG